MQNTTIEYYNIKMRKLPSHLECPMDNVVYVVIEKIAPVFHKFGATPNQITTFSNVFGIGAAYFIYTYRFVSGAACFACAYVLDCLDGYVARKYNMVSKFGDLYDHVSDVFKIVITLVALYSVNSTMFKYFFPIYVLLFSLQLVHFGCQERFYGKPESASLNLLTPLCPATKIQKWMGYTRYFGCGTSMSFLVVVILCYGLIIKPDVDVLDTNENVHKN